MNARRVAATCLAVAWLTAVACGPSAPTSSGPTPDRPQDGRSKPSDGAGVQTPRRDAGCGDRCAPDFTVETFDGDTFALAEQRGTPVVINFWESW